MRILYLFFPLIFLFSPMSHAAKDWGIDWKWLGDSTATTTDPTEAFNYDGSPKNIVNISDQLDDELLEDFYAMVPENQEVDSDLLESSFSNISIIDDLQDGQLATVKVAFLNEGAGFKNALGYFIYDTDTPPTTIAEVNHVIIMANASKDGSGGSLLSGDQVDLMVELEAGQSIGFFINSNGWDSSKHYGYQKDSQIWQPFYTLASLNPDEGLGQRYHVVFTDTRSGSGDDSAFFAFGFEDIKTTYGDKDFNDLIFSVEVTPEDHVKDYDEAVTLPSVSEKIESKTGVLAFEDNWPLTGDYDFNDAVISYEITKTYDADDNNDTIASLEFDYEIEALGAAFHNGLALRVPGLTEDMIESVVLKKTLNGETETITTDSLVTVLTGDDKYIYYPYPLIKDSDFDDDYASFTISEDLFEELSTFDSTGYIFDTKTCLYKTATSESNGCPEGTTSATISLTINLNSKALADGVIDEMPFDHYLFGTDKNDNYRFKRENDTHDWFSSWSSYFTESEASAGPGPGKYLEIHMKAFVGTNVFEQDFSLSDYSDDAVAVDAQSYLDVDGNPFISLEVEEDGESSGNMPWVLDLPSSWKHPVEGGDISEAYPDFFNWVEDNDTNTDWYETNINESALYTE